MKIRSGPHPAATGLAATRLVCTGCRAERAPDLNPFCERCGGSLEAVVEVPAAALPRCSRVFDCAEVLPVGGERMSLGEGGTPLLRLDRLFPDGGVYAKAEWMNPTGSFKDRGSAVAVSAALALGARGIVCASTGNNAASVSAYAARAGLPCIVVLPEGTPAGKVTQALAHGAVVVEVPGSFSEAYRVAEEVRKTDGRWANLTSTYLNPFMTAAHATIFYEVAAELGRTIGSIVVPIGAGPMLAGIMQGARRLHEARAIDRLPVPVGVQGEGCAPIARAFAAGREAVEAWSERDFGLPGSINDPLAGYPEDGTRTLGEIRAAKGLAVAVSDAAIRRALLDLGRREGIGVEPASATPVAALRLHPDLPRPVVLILSGHALKDPGGQPAGTEGRLRLSDSGSLLELIARAGSRFEHGRQRARRSGGIA